MLGSDGEMESFSDPAREKVILATLGAGSLQAALKTASIDKRLSTDQHRAAVSDEVAGENSVERIAFEARNFPKPGGHHALAVDPDASAVNQADAFSAGAKPLELALDLRGCP